MQKSEDAVILAESAVKKAGSRRKAAKGAGVSRATLDSILTGERKPWPSTLEKLKEYVNNKKGE